MNPSPSFTHRPSLQETRQQNLIPTSFRPLPSKHAGSRHEAVDLSLDAFSIVLSTLRDASKFSPVPFLPAAAGIAMDIVGAAQKARRNKDGFKALADDSCELVYVVIHAHKHHMTDDVPADLIDDLQRLVRVLESIRTFARKGASRNPIKAFFRSGVDAQKIRHYREKLQQSMRVFGLQSDIALREAVGKLVSQQVKIDEPEKQVPPVPSGSTGGSFLSTILSSHSVISNAKLGTVTVPENLASGSQRMSRATVPSTIVYSVLNTAWKNKGTIAKVIFMVIAIVIGKYLFA